jgi:hypothetical protein
MRKIEKTRREASTGRFVQTNLGKAKASKFALVEGMSLNSDSRDLISRLERRGLKGDALRKEIISSFATKQS